MFSGGHDSSLLVLSRPRSALVVNVVTSVKLNALSDCAIYVDDDGGDNSDSDPLKGPCALTFSYSDLYRACALSNGYKGIISLTQIGIFQSLVSQRSRRTCLS